MTAKIPKTQIETIAQYLLEDRAKDITYLFKELKEMQSFDLFDLLKDSYEDDPDNVIIKELKRRLKLKCVKEAEQIAKKILILD